MDVLAFLLRVLFGLSSLVPYIFAQDHTQCADNGSDWYTNVVGETPCRTYERLRKICNSQYVLGTLSTKAPPDTCDDQVASCCCNSIAFGLSMLCVTCQHGRGNGSGIDADRGSYQSYLMHGSNSFCTPNTNRSFTNDIQTSVCNNELKIHDSFYDRVFWADGSWFYTWSREYMEMINAVDGNNSFTHCSSTTMNVTSTSSQFQSTPYLTLSATSSASLGPTSTGIGSPSKFLSGGAVAGIVVGSIAFAGVIILFLIWLLWYHRRPAAVEDSEPPHLPFITHSASEDASVTAQRYRNSMYATTEQDSESVRPREKVQRTLPPAYAA
ncbi:hypothetical protein EDD18DRAFT_1133803 [Armillaria luteobubalina]|uniref:Mid2 domain-containing protein n=1 Tax=Armillaria luteobubalina TaxID=153913 RepID=A0AA39TZD0_9AGAR|nr:hypothetical protein EDD18DRAFT_1133803 [Armillaria luteobubalina]